MVKFKVGDRVSIPSMDFLSNGEIIKLHRAAKAAIVKLDEKAPNEYAYNTDEVLMWLVDLELEVNTVAK